MDFPDIELLARLWQVAKEDERVAVAKRRDLEDQMSKALGVDVTKEGTETQMHSAGLQIKIISRLDRKVDADKAQEIAAEHDLQNALSTLFRWKPEIDLAAWRKAPADVTAIFAGSVTVKPGRPSFTIATKEQ
ncbi:MAG TPA: hypothetical protein DCF63_11910 [Planctomycetaceae bacterium]|nr:hypothetical protein [Planctomycetaceae bacterium]